MNELSFRQIHLDFHTSEQLPAIGSDFDADVFADSLVKAHVNSINLFARCHHGWIYYDTKAHPERRHPNLTCNLLKEQVEACQARGIKTPIYSSVMCDKYSGLHHPEWVWIDREGKQYGYDPLGAGFSPHLCLNTPFVDFLKAHVDDIFDCIPIVDGFWLDIVSPQQCYCHRCLSDMAARDLDPESEDDVKAFGWETLYRFTREMSAHIRSHDPDCLIYYNNGHIGPHVRPMVDDFSQLELESLPSYGGYGYMHFPTTARYARGLGLPSVGMTAKFHLLWGDFHSFKNRAAMEFECFLMLAMNTACCVGDQLLPAAMPCPATYELIGSVYKQVEAKEPWCRGARAVSEIGVLTPEEFTYTGRPETGMTPSIWGVSRLLQEAGHQFDVIDSQNDCSGYRLLVLPDEIQVDAALADKLEAYLAQGGALIASSRSGLNPDGTAFASDCFGVKYVGEAPYAPDFLMPTNQIGQDLPKTEHVMYERAVQVEPLPESEVLVEARVPYFNRSYKHFCSHAHTPSSGKSEYPGIIQRGKVIYFAHPIFSQFHHASPLWCKRFVVDAIQRLMPDALVETDAPSTAIFTLNEQETEGRWVLHILHYIPVRRAWFDVVEDVIPLHDVAVSVRMPQAVKAVTLEAQGESLPFEMQEDRCVFTVPKVDGHQMVVMQLGG